jgi:hypothetical protein
MTILLALACVVWLLVVLAAGIVAYVTNFGRGWW